MASLLDPDIVIHDYTRLAKLKEWVHGFFLSLLDGLVTTDTLSDTDVDHNTKGTKNKKQINTLPKYNASQTMVTFHVPLSW